MSIPPAPSAAPVPGTGSAPIPAPGGGGYPGGGTPSGGAVPSGGGYPGGVVQAPGYGVGYGQSNATDVQNSGNGTWGGYGRPGTWLNTTANGSVPGTQNASEGAPGMPQGAYEWTMDAAFDAAMDGLEFILPPLAKGVSKVTPPFGSEESPGGYKGTVTNETRIPDKNCTAKVQQREDAMNVRLPQKVMDRLEELKDLPLEKRIEIVQSEFKPSELLGEPGIIPPVDIHANLAKSLDMNLWEFKEAFKNKGEFDFKKDGHPEYENYGNYFYGIACAARGLDLETAQRAAGYAQGEAGTSKKEYDNWYGGRPYGDDPKDQQWIQRGFRKWQLLQSGQ